MTESVMASSIIVSGLADGDDEVAIAVRVGPVGRFDDGGGVELLEDGGTFEAGIQRQALAVINRGFLPAAVEPDRPDFTQRGIERAGAAIRVDQPRQVD